MKDGLVRSVCRTVYGGGLLVSAACGTEPGTVILALDGVDEVTADTVIQLTGALTRSPPTSAPLFVDITGGAAAAADTANDEGRFTAQVRLRPNQLNTLTLTPGDVTGSTGQPVTVPIRQDRMGPTVVMITPSGDGASVNSTVQVTLSEPVSLVGQNAGMRLLNGADVVAGASTLSNDSVTFTFTPPTPLPENAGFFPIFDGVRDAAGNEPVVGTVDCFITELTVAAQEVRPDTSEVDIIGIQFVGGPVPAFIDPPDVREVRTAIQDGMVTVVLEFTSQRSFDPAEPNNTLAFIDFDTDQDTTTGVATLRDSIFIVLGLPALDTGIGADYVAIVERAGQINLSAVGRYTGFGMFEVLEEYRPTFCGQFLAIRFRLESLGNDDGNMDISVFTINTEGQLQTSPWTVDPTPETEPMTIALAGLFSAPALWSPAAQSEFRQVRKLHFPFALIKR